jgi:tRNA-dihydrouridine synthase
MTWTRGFWADLPRPIVGLSPMDGVTDAVARRMARRCGRPDMTITEFVAVEGLVHGAVGLLDDFLYDDGAPGARPVVAQVYGADPAAFRQAAAIATALGFDGVDVNMGCPAASVAARGAGAALIKTPELAREIVRATRAGIDDWANGGRLERIVPHAKVRRVVAERAARFGDTTRRRIPVSVKTRVGYDEVEAERWVAELALEAPAAITFHGRTLRQLYAGRADWDAIGRAAEVVRGSGVLVLGNGDLADRADAVGRAASYRLDGALIGRATVGNPWVLSDRVASTAERLGAAIEHAEEFERQRWRRPFVAVRRHLYGYCRGFEGAVELRRRLMLAPNAAECRRLIEAALDALPTAAWELPAA